jgi:hypothetical protein
MAPKEGLARLSNSHVGSSKFVPRGTMNRLIAVSLEFKEIYFSVLENGAAPCSTWNNLYWC